MSGERDKLLHIEEKLTERVVGQAEAVTAVSNAIRLSRAGLNSAARPIASFFFLGPTGVGKTELCTASAGRLRARLRARSEVRARVGAGAGARGEDGGTCGAGRRFPLTLTRWLGVCDGVQARRWRNSCSTQRVRVQRGRSLIADARALMGVASCDRAIIGARLRCADPHRHERVHGAPYDEPADWSPARLRRYVLRWHQPTRARHGLMGLAFLSDRVRRGRDADRGGAAQAVQRDPLGRVRKGTSRGQLEHCHEAALRGGCAHSPLHPRADRGHATRSATCSCKSWMKAA